MAKAGQEQGITVNFRGDTVEFDKAVNTVNVEIKGLKKEVKLFNSALKLNPDSFSTLYLKIKNLTKQQEKANEVLKIYKDYKEGLKNQKLEGTKEWLDTEKAIRKTERELNVINVQLYRAKQSMADLEKYATSGNFEDAIRKAGESMVTIGESMQKISKYSQDFLKDATKQAIEFENAFADVKKTVEETKTTTYDDIEKGLRELAQTVPTTADELAKIGGLAGQMGVGADDIVKFTKAMVDFGNATNITAEEAAQEIAQIYNVIGKGGDYSTLNNLLSAIVDLGNNSATTEKEIVEMFKNISSASSRVGMTEQQMAALSATLSSLGLDKGGASAISNIMTQIGMAVDTNSKKLKDWADAAGMSVSEFKSAWGEDAAGALASMLENLKQTVDAGGSLNAVFDDLGIKELRRVDTLGRLVNAQDVYREALERSDKAFAEGNALSNEAAKRYATLKSQLQILKNKFDEFKRTIGEQITPILSVIVEYAGKVLDFLNQLPGSVDSVIAVLTTLLAVLSPLLTVFGKYLLTLTGTNGAVGKLIGNFKGFKGILAGVFGALLTLYVTNEDFRNAVNRTAVEIWNHLKPALENLWSVLQTIWNIGGLVVDKVGELWDKFKETAPAKFFIGMIEAVIETIKIAIDIVAGLISAVKSLFDWFGRVLGLENDVSRNMPRNYVNAMSSGGYSSGGFMAGGFTVNNSFVINGTEQLSNARLLQIADVITDRVNENLGVAV